MNEQLHRFGNGARLCGILNMAPSDYVDEEHPAVIFITAGLLHRPGPYRLYVELSRTLAAMGVPALRFDLSGIGESGRSVSDESAEQTSVTDVREAMDSLGQELGVNRFVVAGLCSGAEVAHRTAVADERVCGVIAMDGYIVRTPAYYWWHYLPRVLSARKWLDFLAGRLRRLVSGSRRGPEPDPDEEALAFWEGPGPGRDQLAADFRLLCQRMVKQLQVFSGGCGDCSYERQFEDAFHDVDFKDLLEVRFLAETDHVYVLNADRRRLMRAITRWISEHFVTEQEVVRRPRIPAPQHSRPEQPAYLSGISASGEPAGFAGRRNIE